MLQPQLASFANDISSRRWSYDIQSLRALAESSGDVSEKARLNYEITLMLAELGTSNDQLQEWIDRAIEANLEMLETDPAEELLPAARLSRLYSMKISGAASWMRYSGPTEFWKEKARSLDPGFRDVRVLELRTLLFFPEAAGGDRGKGELLLQELLKEFPEDPELFFYQVDVLMGDRSYKQAEEILLRILVSFPEHRPARNLLNDLELSSAGLVIDRVDFSGDFQSRREPLEKTAEAFIGRPYSVDAKRELAEALCAYPAVSGVSIEAKRSGGGISLHPPIPGMGFRGESLHPWRGAGRKISPFPGLR